MPASAQAAVHPVQFGDLVAEGGEGEPGQNLPLLLDVEMTLAVEVGRSRLTVGEVMDLQYGSVIQLDKLAGEPADVLVNGRLIARGEVVLMDDNFGVKITDIVTRSRRMKELG